MDTQTDASEQALAHQLERLSPRALLPPTAGAGHALAVVLGVVVGGSALAVGLGNLPAGLALLLIVLPAAFWLWLSVRGWRVNRRLDPDLLARGAVVRARLEKVAIDANRARLEWRFSWRETDDADLADMSGQATVGRWDRRRYFEGMQVAVLVDPQAPQRSQLFPPPGGGTQLDLFGDAVATWLNDTLVPTSRDADRSEPRRDGDGQGVSRD